MLSICVDEGEVDDLGACYSRFVPRYDRVCVVESLFAVVKGGWVAEVLDLRELLRSVGVVRNLLVNVPEEARVSWMFSADARVLASVPGNCNLLCSSWEVFEVSASLEPVVNDVDSFDVR